ncbi:MAG: transposase [Solirubrobacteraceae bacterium]
MMVSLLMFAYSTNERSSRGIERHCRQDIAYRVITGNRVPITRPSHGSFSVTSRRWPSCSVRS